MWSVALAALAVVVVAALDGGASAAFTGANGRIVFASQRQDRQYEIHSMKADGSDRRSIALGDAPSTRRAKARARHREPGTLVASPATAPPDAPKPVLLGRRCRRDVVTDRGRTATDGATLSSRAHEVDIRSDARDTPRLERSRDFGLKDPGKAGGSVRWRPPLGCCLACGRSPPAPAAPTA
jgi:hypothetical protein